MTIRETRVTRPALHRAKGLAACAFIVVLSSCGGRVAQPIEAVKPLDDVLTCAHFQAEKKNNDFRLTELVGERKESVRDNVGMMVSSPFFLDLKNSEKVEAEALERRNGQLTFLMLSADCDEALGLGQAGGSAPQP